MIGMFSSSGFSFLYRVGRKGTRISGDSRSVGTYHMYDLGDVVLMSTRNLCFGAKIRKIGIPLHTPVLPFKVGIMEYSLHRHVFLM